MTTLAIQNMSLAEKLRAMEELWESLSRDEDQLESPAWHADVLEETRQAYEGGQEQTIEWATAKQQLRKRGE